MRVITSSTSNNNVDCGKFWQKYKPFPRKWLERRDRKQFTMMTISHLHRYEHWPFHNSSNCMFDAAEWEDESRIVPSHDGDRIIIIRAIALSCEKLTKCEYLAFFGKAKRHQSCLHEIHPIEWAKIPVLGRQGLLHINGQKEYPPHQD